MHFRERRFLRDRGLSAGAQDARHPADAGQSQKGAEDDSGGEITEDRSRYRRRWRAGEDVEAWLSVRPIDAVTRPYDVSNQKAPRKSAKTMHPRLQDIRCLT